MSYRANLAEAIRIARRDLAEHGDKVPVNRWQAVDTAGTFRELTNYTFSAPVPISVGRLRELVQPNLPWADEHFAERVSGEPLNPGKSYENWPYWREGEADESMRRLNGKFSHTYMERFWPKDANGGDSEGRVHTGIRFEYGDLDDVVNQLVEDPYTRQAYLPIFFPEDTGAVHGERVPCTLGYHFMLRRDRLHMWYFIRSCDIVHYFQDDIYLAGRLLLWVIARCREKNAHDDGLTGTSYWREPWAEKVAPGFLHMTICSLHVFGKDFHVLKK